MAETYETWVELEDRAKRAQSQLEDLIVSRGKALALMTKARAAFKEAAPAEAEAQRTRDAAENAFDRLVTVNPQRYFAERAATVREIERTNRTQQTLHHASHREAWDEADRANTRASGEVLRLGNAVSTAKAWMEPELEGAKKLSAAAESLKELAQRELSGAQDIIREMLLAGQEGAELPGTAQISGCRHPRGPNSDPGPVASG